MKKNLLLPLVLFLSFGIFYGFNSNKKDKGYKIESNPQYKNLQVLPQDISKEELDAVMDSFKAALGVKCSFCHAPGSDGKMDWASDENEHKDVARGMMRMVMEINTNHFGTSNPAEFKVDCFTCHHGEKIPATGHSEQPAEDAGGK